MIFLMKVLIQLLMKLLLDLLLDYLKDYLTLSYKMLFDYRSFILLFCVLVVGMIYSISANATNSKNAFILP